MKRKEFYALGVMSGTSTDGLDFSLIKSEGKEKIKIILSKHHGIVVASKDSLCPSFIFTINYFLEQGKHKKVYYQ